MFSLKDFSNALYALRKAKGYAATIIVTLGVTLGALVAMFNLNYQILAAPLPYQDEDKLVVGETPIYSKDGLLYADVLSIRFATEIYKQQQAKLENLALVGYSFNAVVLRDKPATPKINVAYTTPEYMQMVQMPLLHGRAFEAADGLDQHSAVAVISEYTWRQHYAAAPDIVGKTIRIGDTDFKVVGIADASFEEPRLIGPNRSNDVWLPWDYNPSYRTAPARALDGWHFMLAKLHNNNEKAGLIQQMGTAFNEKYQDAISGQASFAGYYLTFAATPLREKILGDTSEKTLWMLAGALVLLLIASVNIINLILSRAVRQQRNMAIKAALGAQKKHLFLNILTEITVLMAASLVVALVVAQGCYILLQQVAEEFLPRVTELTLNLPSVAFAVGTTVLLALVFAKLIISQINYRALNTALQSSGKGGGLQISVMTRHILIISQISLTAVLLIGSVQILQQSFQELTKDVGFDVTSNYQLAIDEISQDTAPDQRQNMLANRKRELADIRDLLLQHPAVEGASIANYAPINYDGSYGTSAWIKSKDHPNDLIRPRNTTTDQYFLPLLGLELKSGRNFTPQEVADNSLVIIVNETMARQLRPDGQVIGQKLFSSNGDVWEIIGIVNDYKVSNDAELVRSFTPRSLWPGITIILKLKTGATISNEDINQRMIQVSPSYRTAGMFSIEDNLMKEMFADYLAAGLTTALVVLTLFLAFAGIYGVLSYSVQLRRFELGIRMAIGARPGTVLQQVFNENLRPVCTGLLIAAVLLSLLWVSIQQNNFHLELSATGFLLPLLMILCLTSAASLLSVWNIIRKMPGAALRSD